MARDRAASAWHACSTISASTPSWIYRERNRIERFLSELKHFRRVAIRYDKLSDNFLKIDRVLRDLAAPIGRAQLIDSDHVSALRRAEILDLHRGAISEGRRGEP
jgi:DNA-binding transcriptional ArsR family regulator